MTKNIYIDEKKMKLKIHTQERKNISLSYNILSYNIYTHTHTNFSINETIFWKNLIFKNKWTNLTT